MTDRSVQVEIEGMSCASCSQTIEDRLDDAEGVLNSQVNYATGEASITYDPNQVALSHIYELIEQSGYTPVSNRETIRISDMSCANCAETNRKSLNSNSGVLEADVNYATDEAVVEYNPLETDESDLYSSVREAGYTPVESTDDRTDNRLSSADEQLQLTVFGALFSVPFLILMLDNLVLGGIIAPDSIMGVEIGWFEAIIATPVQVVLGWPFYKNSYNALVNNRRANMDVLIALGSTTAYAYSLFVLSDVIAGGIYFDTAVLILVFITFGNYLEERAKSQAGDALKNLLEMEAEEATVLSSEGKEEKIPVSDIQVGDTMKIRPGEKVPTDGVVVGGQSAVNESMITGESVPVEKSEGDEVIGSTLNENGVLKVEATKTGDDTALKQIVKTVKEAQSKQPNIQSVADKISAYFVPAVIINAIIWGSLWMLFPELLGSFVSSLPVWNQVAGGSTAVGGTISVVEFSIIVFASSVLIACPCALGLATPAATMVGTTIGAQNGIIFRGGDILERAKDVDTIVFDKTGTLTEGEMEVTDVITIDEFSDTDVIKYAATAESGSEHPLGEAVIEEADRNSITLGDPQSFTSKPGKGVRSTIGDSDILVGNKELMQDNQIDVSNLKNKSEDLEAQGKTVMFVSYEGGLIGIIGVSDKIKNSSAKAVSELLSRGIEVMMITGDNERVAQSVGEEVGIKDENIYAEVLPEDKSDTVDQIQADDRKVMMVGDGVNDAPALTTAYVGTAIGSGTDVAIEASDVTLMRDDPLDVVKCLRISHATLRKIKQNLFWALGYNTAMIPLASLGLLQPVLAAVAMAFSSVSVLINSLSFRLYKGDEDYRFFNFLR